MKVEFLYDDAGNELRFEAQSGADLQVIDRMVNGAEEGQVFAGALEEWVPASELAFRPDHGRQGGVRKKSGGPLEQMLAIRLQVGRLHYKSPLLEAQRANAGSAEQLGQALLAVFDLARRLP